MGRKMMDEHQGAVYAAQILVAQKAKLIVEMRHNKEKGDAGWKTREAELCRNVQALDAAVDKILGVPAEPCLN